MSFAALTPGRWAAAASAVAFAGAVTALNWQSLRSGPALYVLLHLFGVVAVGIGVLAWSRPLWADTGGLIVALGGAYYLRPLIAVEWPPLFAVGFCLGFLWTAVLAHLVLTWPSGRVSGRSVRWLIAACYAAAVGSQVVRFAVDRPRPPLDPSGPYEHTASAKAASVLVTVLTVVVAAVVGARWLRASRLRRGWAAPVWTSVVVVGVIGTFPSVASLLELPADVEYGLLLATLASALLLVPAIVLARNARLARVHTRLTTLVLDPDWEMALRRDPARLECELAAALGDPHLRVAFPADDGSYVDGEGRPFRRREGSACTTVFRHGELVALLEHDEALNDIEAVATTTEAVAGLAIEGARHYALMRAQVEQIRTSRLRLSTVAFEERHRIQRDLHDGGQQQLLAVLVLLDLARRAEDHAATLGLVEKAHAQLGDAIATLRKLTQGIYPAALTEHGLAAAVEGLADVAPIPVSFSVPGRRWSRRVEATAYFTISEALTNAYKHAEAGHVRVDVRQDGERLLLEIADDGRGAADEPRGLRDRVSTLDGTVSVRSAPGRGTTILVSLPAEEP